MLDKERKSDQIRPNPRAHEMPLLPSKSKKRELASIGEETEGNTDEAPLPSMSRQLRRLASRSAREGSYIPNNGRTINVLPTDSLIDEEDDLALYQSELKAHTASLGNIEKFYRLHVILTGCGIKDGQLRRFYTQGNITEVALLNMLSSVNPDELKSRKRLIGSIESLFGNKHKTPDFINDPEVRDIFGTYLETDVPLNDIFKEVKRSRRESLELIRMHIEWLKAHPTNSYAELETHFEQEEALQSDNFDAAPDTSLTITNTANPANEDFSLRGLQLFWSKKSWSIEPNRLVLIPTATRAQALKVFRDQSRGIISIKASSVLRTLEFYLQKTIIQRALSMKNKYSSEEVRNWAKIKRGKDRIHLQALDNDRQVVFFIEGRDEAYEDL